jgi:hypothetical protein
MFAPQSHKVSLPAAILLIKGPAFICAGTIMTELNRPVDDISITFGLCIVSGFCHDRLQVSLPSDKAI